MGGEMARRFSDEQLTEMHDELKDLSGRFTKHESEEAKKFEAMINAVNQNTTSIDKLTGETREIVGLHRDLQGAARVGTSVQVALLWVAKWGAIGAALAAGVKWLISYAQP